MLVRTKEELKRAKDDKAAEIIIEGELATNVRNTKKIALLGPVVLGVLIALGPISGGMSFMAAAAYTGLDIALIIVAVSIGISLIVAIFRDYEEISFEYGPPARLVLKKKRG